MNRPHATIAAALACFALCLVLPVAAQSPGGREATPEDPWRLDLVAFGDWGATDEYRADQLAVRDGLRGWLRGHPARFVMLLGDNFYKAGVKSVDDPLWKQRFEDVYTGPEFAIPFHAILGNHDWGGNARAQIEYSRRPGTRWRMQEAPWVIEEGGSEEAPLAAFFLIDTVRWRENEESRRKQTGKLRTLLQSSRAHWKIICGHHPVFGNGKEGDDVVLANSLRRVIVEFGVDLYLCGDQHNLQVLPARDRLKADRTLYVVVGGGGADLRDLARTDGTVFQAKTHGFLDLSLDLENARVRLVDKTGAVLHDGTLPKREGARAYRIAATTPATGAGAQK